MGFHPCPIEPDDWANGPNYDEGNCRECDGTGEVIDSNDQEQTCPECGGSGFVQEPYEDDM